MKALVNIYNKALVGEIFVDLRSQLYRVPAIRNHPCLLFQNPGAGGAENGGTRGRVAEADKEHSIRLPRAAYEQLSARRMELSSLVSAHIIWDNEECAIVLLGYVQQIILPTVHIFIIRQRNSCV